MKDLVEVIAKALVDKYFFDKDYKPQSNTFY